MEITGLNFIGTTRSAKGNRSFKTFNPQLNCQNKWDFFEATSEEINEAVRIAQTAFFALKKIDPLQRAAFLREIVRQLEMSKDLVLTIYQLETALPLVRAEAEFRRTINQLINFAQLLECGQWPVEIKEPADLNRSPIKPSLLKTQIGIGPVVVFGASNFPLAYSTIGGDSVAALAAGCPVIVKGHPMHAGTGEIVAKAVIEAAQITGMPNGIFSNLNAQDFNVGEQLVLHNGIEAVGFTGSIKGGTALLKLANTRKKPIPVFAEMGSLNPIILLPSEKDNLQNWAATITHSITNNSGQFCTKP
nr:aldehyde dehydrogenase family protein [Bacteroidia bacterium]